jgi:hypothetical protein
MLRPTTKLPPAAPSPDGKVPLNSPSSALPVTSVKLVPPLAPATSVSV